ncbi:hypothetical protein GG344DRAFT_74696 [Lentinula edodes]|nr:hypothetical protein GG344DRAFT_74696 [Lentinula edodes]
MAVEAMLAIKTIGLRGDVKYPVKAINVLKAHGQSAWESLFVQGYALNCTVASQAPILLGNALLLCFKLQGSRVAVVSGVAAAALRQLVIVMMDKMVNEDYKNTDAEIVGEADNRLAEMTLPDGTTTPLSPSAKDAYSVSKDLCLLANLGCSGMLMAASTKPGLCEALSLRTR